MSLFKHIYLLIVISILFLACNSSGCNNESEPTDACSNLIKDASEDGIDCGGNCIPCEVVSDKELIIIDNAVTDHAEAVSGKLSFGHLIRSLAGSSDPGILVKSIFSNWNSDFQVIGTNSIAPSRSGVNDFLTKWQTSDGHTGNITDWVPDVDNAPFRLLGITNRLDLKDTLSGSAGEGRFTFCAFDPSDVSKSPLTFNLIFEYNLPGDSKEDCAKWTTQWHKLSEVGLTNDQYIDSLISVTEQFVTVNELNQLRSNDFEFELVWELREFRHNESTNSFEPQFLSKTPDVAFNGTTRLRDEINNLQSELDNHESYEFPLDMRSASAVPRTAPSSSKNNPNFMWNTLNADSGEKASINTCNGCHMGHGDNDAMKFLHMKPRDIGESTQISNRLDGADRTFRIINMERLLEFQNPITLANARVSFDSGIDSIQLINFIEAHVSGH